MIKKGFAHRVGYHLGMVVRACARREASTVRWLQGRGIHPMATMLLLGIFKLILAAILLYFTIWVALLYVGFLILIAFLRGSASAGDSLVGFEGEKLFPDPNSPKNSHDPKFD